MNLVTAETYCDVMDEFERAGVRYVITGGAAVVLHGHTRHISDLDIVIDPAPEETNRTLRALAGTGFISTIPVPLSMLTVLRTFDQSGREVDVFVRPYIAFNELWQDSVRVRVGESNTVARIVSIEHLFSLKRTNPRPLDLLDIEGLLALEGRGRDSTLDESSDGAGRKVST